MKEEEEEEEASQDKNLPPSLLSFIVGGTGNGGSERPSGRTAKVVAASAAVTEEGGKERATMRAATDSPNIFFKKIADNLTSSLSTPMALTLVMNFWRQRLKRCRLFWPPFLNWRR